MASRLTSCFHFVLVSLLALGTLELRAQAAHGGDSAPPKNVILMIGDGMGLNQLVAARHVKGQLRLEKLRVMGASYTHSARNYVTDSSASATALASGYLIVNGEVGVHPDGSPIKLIVDYAEEAGKWTGIVATSRITHATPASMVTRVKSRGSEDDIALQLAYSEIDVILGGGWDKFLPARGQKIDADKSLPGLETASRVAGRQTGNQLPVSFRRPQLRATELIAEKPLLWDGKPYGTRKDGRNLIEDMKGRGYRFVRTPAELSLVTAGEPGRLLGLFHSGAMAKVAEGRSPSLGAMSLAALKILSRSPRGFFLMIEGSQIDWGGHDNDFDFAVNEAADFDTAVGVVLDFLRESGIEGETLLVITADHETGGLTLNVHPNLPLGMEPRWTTTYHTAAPVPVFAAGVGAESYGGLQNHEQIGRRLVEAVAGRKVEFKYPPVGSARPSDAGPSKRL